MDLPSIISFNEAFYPHEGGAEMRSYELLTRLAKKGFRVKVLTNPFPGDVDIPGIEVDYVSSMEEKQYFKNSSRKVMGVLKFASAIRRAIRENQDFDVYNFDEFPLYHAIRAFSGIPEGKKAYFVWHEVLRDFYRESGILWGIAASWEKKVTRMFRNHIAVSNATASILKNTYGVSNVNVIPNGVRTKELTTDEAKDWGKIVYVGRIEPHKQIDTLIRKFDGMSDFQLNIIGGGSQLGYLRGKVDGKKNVRIIGHLERDDLIKEIKSSWLFVMPSAREGFSIASLEAMAASVPVITIKSQYNLAATEIVKAGYNGLVSSGFEEMMVDIKGLYRDEAAWKKLSGHARDFSRDYDWDVITDRLSDLYTKN
ncbi:MAG: glycosyltransferase family 4 protein [Candidatus Thermoplasmatota archaeon]|nr:glycosyltransferase family 4 protein [Candidatus Thermoplasmatota archaeon]